MIGKRVQFDDATWEAIEAVMRDSGGDWNLVICWRGRIGLNPKATSPFAQPKRKMRRLSCEASSFYTD